jgi:hypothetical protein
MKKIIILAPVLALLALSVSLFTGCTTTAGNSTGGVTSTNQPPPVITQQTLNDASIVLRSAARNAAALGIQNNADNRKYVQLAVTTLDTFLTGNDYTPGALVKALEPVVKQVKDLRVALAVNTVTDMYEVFFGRYVKGQIANAANGNALLFLTALRQGASEALDLTTVAPPQ